MPIIAMTQEVGTLSAEIANELAKRLNLEVFYLGALGSAGPGAADTTAEDESAFERFIQRADGSRLAWAEPGFNGPARGNVLLCGHGVAELLAQVPHVLTVRVRTTMALRVKRLAARTGEDDPEQALQLVLASDDVVSTTLAAWFGRHDREDPSRYAAVVDSGRSSIEACTEQVAALARDARFQVTPDVAATIKHYALRLRARAAVLGHATTLNCRVSRPNPAAPQSRSPRGESAREFAVTPNESARIAWRSAPTLALARG